MTEVNQLKFERYKNIYSGILMLAVGLFLLLAAGSIPSGAAVGIGSDFMPRVASGLMAVLGIIILISGVKEAKKDGAQEEANAPAPLPKGLLCTVALLFLYMLLMVPVGFIITTVLYITAQAMILAPQEKRNPLLFFVFSLAFTIVIYFVFRNAFSLMLPSGILPF